MIKKIFIIIFLSLFLPLYGSNDNIKTNLFELPIKGAKAYAFVKLNIRKKPKNGSLIIGKLKETEEFTIIEELGNYWKINYDNKIGYVNHKYCYINLPDILPSIIYINTNSIASILKVGNINIPNITNEQLYNVEEYNKRIKMKTFIMPLKYESAKKLAIAQKMALLDGNTLIVYEAFRPLQIQRNIVKNIKYLIQTTNKVQDFINIKPWSINWFISTRVSNHQKGSAVDVSLGKILQKEIVNTSEFKYLKISNYKEYEMQTNIHNLSIASTIYDNPNKKEYSKKVTFNTLQLHKYMNNAGFNALASEWWHFDDKEAFESNSNKGNYFIISKK